MLGTGDTTENKTDIVIIFMGSICLWRNRYESNGPINRDYDNVPFRKGPGVKKP